MFPLFVNLRRPHGAAFSFALFGAGIAQRLRAVADPCGGWINNDRQYRQHHRHKLHRFFQHMTKDSAKGLSDVVPVWKSDRFARNRYNGARYKNFRIKNEVKIIPARENISERSKEIILETMLEGYNVLKHNKGQRRSRRCPLLLPCPRALSSEAMDTAEQMAASALRSLVRLNMPSLEPAHRIKSTGAA